ncbi:ectonucleotide pyrophosphatase/phosphodiesterase [Adhaeribacter aquaticus]|uniref:alkaline phosphatase family protein n=1 Tax=Adhaeribacter aquaticus TaxID=299567 RepID=UPI0004231386|nr:ectonucleotide pyrophosphatase/phosphodiesterase [Adhaeribacter aquaticus]
MLGNVTCIKQQILIFVCLVLCNINVAQIPNQQNVLADRRNGPEAYKKPYVILISVDGFRADYAEKYKAETIRKLQSQSVQAKYLIPSFPSKTFPNHYTLTTGLYPAHHGIINNYFYNPSQKSFYAVAKPKVVRNGTWYGGTPLWVLAEQQQVLSACLFWPGSEANIKDVRPSYYYNYTEKIPIEQRIQIIVDWLNLPAEKRPHLISFYLPEVDKAGHAHGPNAPETGAAVRFIDAAVKQLTEAVATTGLPVNYVLVSDHGMVEVDNKNTMLLPGYVDTAQFVVAINDVMVELYSKTKNQEEISKTYKKLKQDQNGYKAYIKTNTPARFHYRAKDDSLQRIGDIILLAQYPKIFRVGSGKANPGTHGFDPKLKDLRAIFFAWGPAIEKRIKLKPFENVHVYPFVARLLELEYSFKIDGDDRVVKKVF